MPVICYSHFMGLYIVSSSCFLLVVNNLPGNWLKPTKIYLIFLSTRRAVESGQDLGA